MMKISSKLLLLAFALILNLRGVLAQSHHLEILHWQEELNAEFADKETSPLNRRDRRRFKGLDFFPIDSSFRFECQWVRTPGEEPFMMATSNGRKPWYEKYGELRFHHKGKEWVLEVYQSHHLRQTEEYADYLFLPFLDKTNSFSTYGGGRYLEMKIPEGETVVIDFNKAYNPYCAYSDRYSCPLVPRVNKLGFEVIAGVQDFGEDH